MEKYQGSFLLYSLVQEFFAVTLAKCFCSAGQWAGGSVPPTLRAAGMLTAAAACPAASCFVGVACRTGLLSSLKTYFGSARKQVF